MCLEKGTATREDIDTTLKLGMNHPMGPLQLGAHLVPPSYTYLLTPPVRTQLTCPSLTLPTLSSLADECVDSIGLDTCLAIQQTLYEGTRDSKYRPSILLERMVDAQWYGRKNGKGFYEYNN